MVLGRRRADVGSARVRHVRVALASALEGRLSQGAFVPTYFDVLYAASRIFAPVQPGPQLTPPPPASTGSIVCRANLGAGACQGEAHLQMFHRATLGIAYEDGEQARHSPGAVLPA